MKRPRLPGRSSGSSTRSWLLTGGALTVLATLAGLGATAARKRYRTGEAKITSIANQGDGLVIVLDDQTVFWAPASLRSLLEQYTGEREELLPYKIDLYRRTRNGLAVGGVNTGD